MEEEKKDINKDEIKSIQKKANKIVLITVAIVVAIILIISGVVVIVSNINEKKKEVQTSSQLENENIQEENTIKEQTNKTLLTKEMLSQNNYKFLYELIQFRISGEKYYSEGDYLKLAVRHQYENKFIVHTIILSNKHINQPDYQLKSVLSNSEYEKMYYLTKNITKEKIYYACFELKDNVYLEDAMGAGYPNGFDTMFNIQGENIVEIPNGTDDYTANQIAQRVANELDRYYEKLKNNEPIETSSNTNSTVIEDIQDRIDFFNSYYYWNFHPTNEQMQQMVEFANSTSNFTNDTLADFIIDKGWLPDSGTGTVSSNNSNSNNNNNNGNSGSSNKNTSSSSNDDDNTSREVIATVNINLKELIAKNTVATEIKNESERIDIRVYVEDAFVKDDYFEYFSGGASVPNTITTTVKVYENEKKLNDKRKVIITMDNTRTLIKETTLYDGEMIFNKTGTYEIK